MKNIVTLSLSLFVTGLLFAQTKHATTSSSKPKPKPKTSVAVVKKPSPVAMKTAIDSLSYALGMSIANFYKQMGVNTINTNMVSLAINDAKKNKTLLSELQMNEYITGYMQKQRHEKSAGTKKAGTEFLSANKAKPGVISLPSGLQYQIIKEGTGPKPVASDTVKVHYRGTLIDETVFDSSIDRGQPIEFPVNGVIRGWIEALQLMPVGSKWKLFIPSELAYGDSDAGPTIPGGSTLIFDVELLEIVKK